MTKISDSAAPGRRIPDPRTMLLMAACLSTLGVLIEETWLLFCVFVFTLLLSAILRVRLMFITKRLRGLISIIIFVALMESAFRAEGRPILALGTLTVLTEGGLLHGADTLLRMGTVIASASIFTLTTSRQMIQGLIQLKIPYVFAFMASVALRFLPVFTEEFRDTLTAIQLRGVNLKKIPFKDKLKIYGCILAPVAYGAVDKAQKLSYAMELRAFRAYPKRTSRFLLKYGAADYVLLIIFPLITAALLAYYYILLK